MAFLTGGILYYLDRIMGKTTGSATYDPAYDSNEAISEAIAGIGGSSNQTFTATETEPCVAGDIACMTSDGGVIPFSSLVPAEVTVVGGELDNAISGNDPESAVAWINNNVFVQALDDADGGNDLTLVPCRQEPDGTTTVGSNFIVVAGTCDTPDVCGIGNNRGVVVNEEGGGTVNAHAFQLTPSTLYLSFGAVDVLEAVATTGLAITDVDDDKFCAIYQDGTNADGNLIACTVNSSTLAITTGTKASIGPGNISTTVICKVDTDLIACGYRDTVSFDNFCNIADTTDIDSLSVGGDTEYADAITGVSTAITATDATHIVIFYSQSAPAVASYCIAASISTVTPTFGSAVPIGENTDGVQRDQITTIDSSHVLVAYENSTKNTAGKSVLSLAGTVITAGAISYLANDIMQVANRAYGKCLDINDYNDIVLIGNNGTLTYAVMFDVGWVDETYTLSDISGVASDASGTIIVDGIDEGNASGEDSRLTYGFDSGYSCVREKGHSQILARGYVPRVRVVDVDTLKAIGG